MALYVVQVPDPPPGTDWSWTVPGEYLYNVTGISATLNTPNGPSPTAKDASLNNNDGTYMELRAEPTAFVPGLVAGDLALQSGDPDGFGRTFIEVPPTADWRAPFTILWWQSLSATWDLRQLNPYLADALAPAQVLEIKEIVGAAGGLILRDQVDAEWDSGVGIFPADGLPHMVAVTFDGTNATLYLDGAVSPWSATGASPGAPVAFTNAEVGGGNGPPEILDEFATFPSELNAGTIAGIFAAAAVDFATYSAAVLAATPNLYYHLDDLFVGAQDQVTLLITDGSTSVMQIPTGFPEAPSGGTWRYSWQPRLQSSTQPASGTPTTVAVPPLILPAGYTLGTNTLDLVGAAQWSDITIWWDSNIMDARAGQSAYLFPPPVHLVYHQEPH